MNRANALHKNAQTGTVSPLFRTVRPPNRAVAAASWTCLGKACPTMRRFLIRCRRQRTWASTRWGAGSGSPLFARGGGSRVGFFVSARASAARATAAPSSGGSEQLLANAVPLAVDLLFRGADCRSTARSSSGPLRLRRKHHVRPGSPQRGAPSDRSRGPARGSPDSARGPGEIDSRRPCRPDEVKNSTIASPTPASARVALWVESPYTADRSSSRRRRTVSRFSSITVGSMSFSCSSRTSVRPTGP